MNRYLKRRAFDDAQVLSQAAKAALGLRNVRRLERAAAPELDHEGADAGGQALVVQRAGDVARQFALAADVLAASQRGPEVGDGAESSGNSTASLDASSFRPVARYR